MSFLPRGTDLSFLHEIRSRAGGRIQPWVPQLPAQGAIEVHDVRPSDTDSAIQRFNLPHRVFLDDSVAARGQLLVFLPGTGATTADQDAFGRTAAGIGYHVVYLMYPNDVPAAVCQDDEDESSFESFRREIIAGGDRDPRVNVDRADSIENRIVQLIRWLASNRTSEGWRQFLTEDSLNWPKVVLAGHSQGGGHAQLLAKDHAVARVVVLGSPKDYNTRHARPAAWYGGGATPASRMFAFVHEQDSQAISLSAASRESSGIRTYNNCGYGQSRPALSRRPCAHHKPGRPSINSGLAHLGLVFDFTLPRSPDGQPLYRPVWLYMLTTPVE